MKEREERIDGRDPATLNSHLKGFTVPPGASTEDRQDGSRETGPRVIARVRVRGGSDHFGTVEKGTSCASAGMF